MQTISIWKRIWLIFLLSSILSVINLSSVFAHEPDANNIRQTNSEPTPGIEPVPADQPSLGLVYAGLERDSTGNCGDLLQIQGTNKCTHGPDVPPPGTNIANSTPPIIESQAQPLAPAICDGDGTSGYRIQVMYVRASDQADRYATYLSSIRNWATQIDNIYYQSATAVGSGRRIRYVHDASCTVSVLNVVLSPEGDDDFSFTIDELAALGYDSSNRKYMIFMDANVYCGIGTFYNDDRFGQENWNNIGPDYGRSDNGCWFADVAAHELNHNLGGVQDSAPNSSLGGHCVDEWDVMCYSDHPYYPEMQIVCPDGTLDTMLDCNHDDYYHPNPPAGSYLATYWNTANNRFLIQSTGTAGISLEKSPALQTISPGATANFTLELRNVGSLPLFNVALTDALCGTGPTFIGGDSNADAQLDGSEVWVFSCSTPNVQADFTNFASVTAESTDATVVSDSDSALVDVVIPLPAAPTNLTAVVSTSSQINLTWVDNANNETSFKIERCQGAGCTVFAQIATVGANVTSYASAGLAVGTSYSYRVRANNATGDSGYSNVATATPTVPPPAAPSNLVATVTSGTQISLTWTDNSNNELGFKIERCQGVNCTAYSQIVVVGANIRTYANAALATGTSYSYRVRSYLTGADSAYSNIATATPAVTPPAAPSNLVAAVASGTQLNLSWTDNSNNELGFKIERCQGAGCTVYTQIATVGVNIRTYANAALVTGTTYSYRVRSYLTGADSAYSNIATATPTVAPPLPPSNLQASAPSNTQINLAWTDTAINETGFKIERCQNGGCVNFAQIATVGANILSYANAGLVANTTYCYRVRAYNAGGDSAYSNIACRLTGVTAPTGLVAIQPLATGTHLRWDDNANNETGFRLERCTGVNCANFVQLVALSANVIGYRDATLVANTTYRYRVVAYNAGGNSLYSNIISITTTTAVMAAEAETTLSEAALETPVDQEVETTPEVGSTRYYYLPLITQ